MVGGSRVSVEMLSVCAKLTGAPTLLPSTPSPPEMSELKPTWQPIVTAIPPEAVPTRTGVTPARVTYGVTTEVGVALAEVFTTVGPL